MSAHLVTALVLGLAVGTGAWTLTKASISLFIRVKLAKVTGKHPNSKVLGKLFELAKCPYCVAHWLAFAAIAIWRPWIVPAPLHVHWLNVSLQFLATSFALVAVASIITLVLRKALT